VTQLATTGRQSLLDRVVERMLASGTATASLRSLAAEIGSSHRMLIYHFGGQEGLVRAVVEEVEARQRAALAQLGARPDMSAAEVALAFWERLSAPDLRAVERLFFQLYTRLLELGDDAVVARLTTAWLEPVTELMVARGYSPARARRLTRLGMAVYRGLLLDLLATGDTSEVDAALRSYVSAVFGRADVAGSPDAVGSPGRAADLGRADRRHGRPPGRLMTDPDRPSPERIEPGYLADEREMLTSWLDYHRATLAMKCAGLRPDQLRLAAVPPSDLSLLGLVRHLADVERSWFRRTMAGEDAAPIYYTDQEPDGEFVVDDAEPAEAFVRWRQECEHSRRITAAISSLDTAGRQRRGYHVSLRWVLVHMIEEYARHNGHADLIRERLDGATGD